MDAVRRDRNLRARYPNEAAHQKARVAALDDLRRTLQVSEKRLEALAVERKPLLDEAEFYVNRPMPTSLRQQLDGVEAAAEAQRSLIQNQQAEALRINATFDAELTRLRALWAGAPPGSLGPLVVVIPPAPAAPASGGATGSPGGQDAVRRSPGAAHPSLRLSSSVTWPGLALPLVAFIA